MVSYRVFIPDVLHDRRLTVHLPLWKEDRRQRSLARCTQCFLMPQSGLVSDPQTRPYSKHNIKTPQKYGVVCMYTHLKHNEVGGLQQTSLTSPCQALMIVNRQHISRCLIHTPGLHYASQAVNFNTETHNSVSCPNLGIMRGGFKLTFTAF